MARRVLAALAAATVLLCLSTASASGVDPTKLSLPKGPGSIEGLGKQFTPSLASGTASYGFDISVPPGSNGFQPTLSLDYDSGGGVTELGMGWSLGGVPRLRRRTENGLPHFDARDAFELVGLGIPCDLLEVSTNVFRPQFESGVFARAERSADGKTWEVRTKAGVTYRFGGDGAFEAEGSNVATYLLREQLDLHGHKIAYAWDTSSGHARLTAVTYNDFSADARNEVLFTYEDRPDPHTLFSAGIKQSIAKRLTSIDVKHGGALVRRYELAYAPGVHSRIGSVTLVGSDGVSKLPSASVSYAELHLAADASSVVAMKSPPGRSPSDPNVDLADLDGDGLPDLLVTKSGAYRSYLNHDGLSWKDGVDWPSSSSPSLELAGVGVQLADVDGDGAIDLLAKSGTSAFRYFPGSTATSFAPSVSLLHSPGFTFEDPDVRIADMDGDRRVDVVLTNSAGISIGYNLGGKDWAEPVPAGLVDDRQPLRFSDGGRTQLCDVNGDRVQDFCYLRSESLTYWLGRGRGKFEPATSATGVPSWDPSSPWELHDVDGDGWVDLAHVGVDQVDVALAIGAGKFDAVKTIAHVPTKNPTTVVRWADMNGSGTTDIVWIDVSGAASSAWQYLELFPQGRAGLLTSIDNGYGKTARVIYAPASLDAAAARDAGAPWTSRMNVAMPVVRRLELDSALGDPRMASEYTYSNGTFSPIERTFAGFGGGIEKQLGDAYTPTLVSESTFDVGLDVRELRGAILTNEQRDEHGVLFTRTTTTYTKRSLTTALDGRSVDYAFKSAEAVQHIEGTDLGKARTTLTEWDEDAYGNVTTESHWGEAVGDDKLAGGDEAITLRTFAQNVDDWILGDVATEELQDGSGHRVRMARSYYDGDAFVGLPLGQVARGDVSKREEWVGPAPDAFELATATKYDADGHPIETKDGRGGHRIFVWNPTDHTTVDSESVDTGALTLTASAVHEAAFGNELSLTLYNGQTTSMQYDAFGRIVALVRPGDSLDRPTQSYRYIEGAPLSRIVTSKRVWSGRDDVEVHETLVDGFGRDRGTLVLGDGGKWVLGQNGLLDARGNVRRAFRARFVDAGQHDAPDLFAEGAGVDSWHDALGRTIRTKSQLGIETRAAFAPFTSLTWDGAQASSSSPYEHTPKTEMRDGLGRIVAHVQVLGGAQLSARFSYDAAGDLLSHVDPEGNASSYGYDGRGRRVLVDDADVGKHTFVFDVTGNLVEHHKPDGVVQRFAFDLAGRPVTDDWNGDGTPEITRSYDVGSLHPESALFRGLLADISAPSGTTAFDYDERGRLTATHVAVNGTTYVIGSAFDDQDREALHIFPDQSSLATHFDSRGLIGTYGDDAIKFAYDADALETQRAFNTGVVELSGYDDDRRRTEVRAKAQGGAVIQDLKWVYDETGNILQVQDLRGKVDPSRDRSETYGYDNLYRLTTASGTWGKADWSYSPSGNITRRTSSVTALDAGDLTYGGNGAGPHALTGFKGRAITYDVLGRMKSDGDRSYVFDDGDHLVQVSAKSGASVKSVYDDGDLRRVRYEHNADGADHTTIFLDTWSEVRDGKLARFIVHGGRRIVRLSDTNGTNGSAASALTKSESEEPPAGATPRGPHHVVNASAFFLTIALFAALLARYKNQLLQLRVALPVVALVFASVGMGCGHGGGDPPPQVPQGTIRTLSNDDELLFADAIGSLTEQTSGDGATSKGSFAAYPYGLDRYDTSDETRKFANAPRDKGVEIDQMGARAYAPDLQQWVSADPLVVHAPERLALDDFAQRNPYAYANRNPTRFVDPSGHWADVADTAAKVLAAAGVGTAAAPAAPVVAAYAAPIILGAAVGALIGYGIGSAVNYVRDVNDAMNAKPVIATGSAAGGLAASPASGATGYATKAAPPPPPPPNKKGGGGEEPCYTPDEAYHKLRAEFDTKSYRMKMWRKEAELHADRYSQAQLDSIKSGKPPMGSDGKSMEIHHKIPLRNCGTNDFENLQFMTHTDHRGPGNYKKNHPNVKKPKE